MLEEVIGLLQFFFESVLILPVKVKEQEFEVLLACATYNFKGRTIVNKRSKVIKAYRGNIWES